MEGGENKDMQRLEIQKHVEEYLARGGKIEVVQSTDNAGYRNPIKRTRKEHTNKLKKRDFAASRG